MIDEILFLIADGKLEPELIDENMLEKHQRPALKAMAYCLSQGLDTPLSLPTVWKVAQARFHAGKDTKDYLRALDSLEFEAPVLDSVQSGLVLHKVIEKGTLQLASGDYDLPILREMLNVNGTAKDIVLPIAVPTKTKEERYALKTNIPQIDRVITGLRAELIVVAARPKQGKSNMFFNLIWKNPDNKILYFTIADYDYEDVNFMLSAIHPDINKRKNLLIADGTAHLITPMNVEALIEQHKPDLVIVDRAEIMAVQRKRKIADSSKREELGDIFQFLRRVAKQYGLPIFVDAQLSAEDDKSNFAVMGNMAEDKTNRQATLDLFFGLRRRHVGNLGAGEVSLYIQGRRHGLPEEVKIPTDNVGRYLGERGMR